MILSCNHTSIFWNPDNSINHHLPFIHFPTLTVDIDIWWSIWGIFLCRDAGLEKIDDVCIIVLPIDSGFFSKICIPSLSGNVLVRLCIVLVTGCIVLVTLCIVSVKLCIALVILCIVLVTLCISLLTLCIALVTLCIVLVTLCIVLVTLYIALVTLCIGLVTLCIYLFNYLFYVF